MRRHSAKVVQLVQLAVGDDFRQDSGHCPGLAIQNTSCYSASDKKTSKKKSGPLFWLSNFRYRTAIVCVNRRLPV